MTMKKNLARLLSCVLAMLLSCSVLPLSAAAAEDVSQWSNDKFAYQDYATLYDDYYHLRTVSDGRKGVSWPEGAQVIFGESSYAHTDVEIHEDTSVTSIKFPKSTVILGMYALNAAIRSPRSTLTS